MYKMMVSVNGQERRQTLESLETGARGMTGRLSMSSLSPGWAGPSRPEAGGVSGLGPRKILLGVPTGLEVRQ